MAKYKRLNVGSVVKSKDKTKGDYIQIRGDVKDQLISALQSMDSKKGLYLTLESKQQALESLENAVSSGKLSEEHSVKARERIENMPEWVRFNVVLVQKS